MKTIEYFIKNAYISRIHQRRKNSDKPQKCKISPTILLYFASSAKETCALLRNKWYETQINTSLEKKKVPESLLYQYNPICHTNTLIHSIYFTEAFEKCDNKIIAHKLKQIVHQAKLRNGSIKIWLDRLGVVVWVQDRNWKRPKLIISGTSPIYYYIYNNDKRYKFRRKKM